MQCHIIKAIASVNNKKNLLCQSRVHNAQIRRNSDARLMSRCFRGLVYFKIHFRALFHMKMWSLKDILNTFQIRSKNKLIGENVVTLVHEYCSLTPRYGLLVKALSYRISGACWYHFHTASYTLSSSLTLRLLLLSREINWSVVKWTKSFSLATWVKFHSMYSIVFCFSCPRSRSSDNSTNLMQLFVLRCSMLRRSQARIASSI